MGYVEMIRVTPDQLTLCDSCGHEGLTTTGREIFDSHDVPILWFCFNCVNRVLN